MYNKLENENENQYILRICSMKDQNNWTWEDIASILNESLGHNYGESAYRKRYNAFNRMLEDNSETIFTEDEYLKKIKEEKIALEKERQKLYATKVEMQRNIRQDGRFELFYENIKNTIECLPLPQFKYNSENKSCCEDKEYVLTMADIHAGANFDLPCNHYSLEECESRFNKLLNYTINYVVNNNIFSISIVELGDTITGMLRISDVKLNETSVVDATVRVARMIAQFLNKLSEYCDIEYYHTPQSNHSQMRPLGTKASELANEDIEYIIGNYIKDMLANNDRVNVHTNFGNDYIDVAVFDYDIIAMHGHTIKSLDNALRDLSVIHQRLIDYVLVGHYHNGSVIPGNERSSYDTEVLMCPSFQGTDPYAFNKLGKSSKAACKMFVFDRKYGCTGTEKFILN